MNPSTVELEEDLIRRIPQGSRVLEFACAGGRTAFRLEEMGYSVTAFDIDPEVIDACRERKTNVEFLVEDARDLPFPSGSFDACIMNAFMTMMVNTASRQKAFSEAKRVLRKGGLMYLADFLLERSDPRYKRRYEAHEDITGEYGTFIVYEEEKELYRAHHHTEKELLALFNEGFRIIEVRKSRFRTFHENEIGGLMILAERS